MTQRGWKNAEEELGWERGVENEKEAAGWGGGAVVSLLQCPPGAHAVLVPRVLGPRRPGLVSWPSRDFQTKPGKREGRTAFLRPTCLRQAHPVPPLAAPSLGLKGHFWPNTIGGCWPLPLPANAG